MTFARTATVKPPWRKGTYARRAAALKLTATPFTLCARCGRLLHEHPPHKTGAPVAWDAGHQDHPLYGQPRLGLPQAVYDTWPIALEASSCNRNAGGKEGLRRMKANSRRVTRLSW